MTLKEQVEMCLAGKSKPEHSIFLNGTKLDISKELSMDIDIDDIYEDVLESVKDLGDYELVLVDNQTGEEIKRDEAVLDTYKININIDGTKFERYSDKSQGLPFILEDISNSYESLVEDSELIAEITDTLTNNVICEIKLYK